MLSVSFLALALASSALATPKIEIYTPAPLLEKRGGHGSPPPAAGPVDLVGLRVDDIDYFSPLKAESYTFNSEIKGAVAGYTPVSVIEVTGRSVSCATLAKTIAGYKAKDDVFSDAFLGGIILSSSRPLKVSGSLAKCFKGAAFVVTAGPYCDGVPALKGGKNPPPGPYLAKVDSRSVTLTRVYRVYRDEQQAFTTASVPLAGNAGYADYAVATPGMNTLSIGVPSRLYFTPTSQQPLAGLRLALKDIYDLQGLRTGDGNRAYWNTYPPRTSSAFAVQRLIDLGAQIVGKAKTSQFANGETATADWVDQLEPFNDRGDGYNQPSSSSSGPGAAMGAYPWLDVAIGSDTGGSIRGPAGANGIYGLRPSWGAISLEGVMPLAAPLDTSGGFARNPSTFSLLHKSLYGNHFQNYPAFPKRIIVSSDEFPSGDDEADAVFNAFIPKLQAFLGATIDTADTINAAWARTGRQAQFGPLSTYLSTTYAVIIGYYQYFNFALPWINYYRSLFGGNYPFVDPAPTVRWQYGVNATATGYNNAITQKTIFQQFWAEYLPKNAETCSDLYLYAQSTGSPSPRNIYLSPPRPPVGYGTGRVSPFAGNPDMVWPVGQVPRNSSITRQIEELPVGLSVMAAAGCDYMLLDLTVALGRAGILETVATGPNAF